MSILNTEILHRSEIHSSQTNTGLQPGLALHVHGPGKCVQTGLHSVYYKITAFVTI